MGRTEFKPCVRCRSVGVGTLTVAGTSANACILVVVYIHAVERDVVLIAPRAQHFTGRRHSRLQTQKFDDIAGLQRAVAGPAFA